MPRPLLLAFLSALYALHASAAPTFEWVATAGGAKSDKTRAVTVDREGNVFLCGEVSEDSKFGDIAVKGLGQLDFFVAKLDAKGHFLWARTLGGSLIDRGYGVATDAAGNAYVTGHYQSTDVMVGGQALPNHGEYDIFVAKYDRDGKQLWVRTAGGKGYDYGHGIAVDTAGHIVVTGGVVGEAHFGDLVVPNEPGSHVFCAKYDAEGALLWVKTARGAGSNNGQGIAVDASNNIYIGGSHSGVGTFGKQELSSKTGAALVMKLNEQGDPVWTSVTAGTPRALASEIAADAQGRVWISGIFHGSVALVGKTYQALNDEPKNNDGFIAQFDASGKMAWAQALIGPTTDYVLGVATDGQGHAFATGEFSETATFAGETLHSRGATDIFVAAFDGTGKVEWITQAGGTKGDNAYSIVHDPSGALIFGGACMAPADFGDQQVKTTGGADLYGAKLRIK